MRGLGLSVTVSLGCLLALPTVYSSQRTLADAHNLPASAAANAALAGASAQERRASEQADHLGRLAQGYMSLTQTFDAAVAAKVFPVGLRESAPTQLKWMREHLGACTQSRVLGVSSSTERPDATKARFELICARGRMQVAFEVDAQGQVTRMLAAAEDQRPELRVVALARAAVGWRASRNPAPSFVHAQDKSDFVRRFAAHSGEPYSCRLGEAQLASSTGAVFSLHCDDREDARLVIDIERAADRSYQVRRIAIDASRIHG